VVPICLLGLLLLLGGCNRGARQHGEAAYIAAPQVNLRDRLSAVYNKAGVVKNGERVEVLEKNKRFARVRSARGEEGWIEARHLVGPEVAELFAQMARENAATPAQAQGTTRAELNMHTTPGRDTDHLFRLDDGAKLEILKRGSAVKPQSNAPAQPAARPAAKPAANKPGATITKPSAAPAKPAATAAKPNGAAPQNGATPQNPAPQNAVAANANAEPPAMEDWLLVRDAQKHVGWVLARMVDVEVPLDIAQYAEGQRITAVFVLNQVTDVGEDGQTRQVSQYLLAMNEPKDGQPWDYNQIRVFSWNARRHRYETAYRERDLPGVFPIVVGHQVFDREGDLPTFTLRVKDDGGTVREKRYKFVQPMVKRLLTPEEQKLEDERKAQRVAEARSQRAAAVHQNNHQNNHNKNKKKRR
jgi:SH3-like domain-containing protein